MRTGRAAKNILSSLILELIIAVFGMIMPRWVIGTYGSAINGLTSTILQLLQVISLLQAGAVGASIYTMYKPVADKNYEQVSSILYASRKYFSKIGGIFIAIVFIISPIFGYVKSSEGMSLVEIMLAVMLLGINGSFSFFFVSQFDILFSSFQKRYIISIATMFEKLIYYGLLALVLFYQLNFLFMYVAVLLGGTSKVILLFFLRKKQYGKVLPKLAPYQDIKIKSKGNLLISQVFITIIDGLPSVLVTLILSLKYASVYSIYLLVLVALRMVIKTISLSVSAIFGNVTVKEKDEKISQVFNLYMFVSILTGAVLVGCASFLFMPFINVYTKGITDINYYYPLLGIFVVLHTVIAAVYNPLHTATITMGYFKPMSIQIPITVIISLILSSVLTYYFGLPYMLLGVVFFYFVSTIFDFVILKKKTSWFKTKKIFIRLLLLIGISIIGFILSYMNIVSIGSIGKWIVVACFSLIIVLFVVLLYCIIFERKELKDLLYYGKSLIKRKKTK